MTIELFELSYHTHPQETNQMKFKKTFFQYAIETQGIEIFIY